MFDPVDLQTGRGEPCPHHLVIKAEPNMRVGRAQLLALMRREIDDEQGPARGEDPRGLGNRCSRASCR